MLFLLPPSFSFFPKLAQHMSLSKELRQRIRAHRNALPKAESQRAARDLAKRIVALPIFTAARHIAGYLANNGEMDPAPILEQAFALNKRVYLPVLLGKQEPMGFAPYWPQTKLKPNRFGIPEPDIPLENMLSPKQLDLVVTPLVAFDHNGNRLGMGGGFYDRTFAFLNQPPYPAKPCLLGVAYELQKVTELVCQPWDVPLAAIVTEAAIYTRDNRFQR